MKYQKVSIITPNYNYGHFIGNTIESVLKQSHKDIEHIIVDDGSTDNSVDIIRSYTQKFPGKIKLIEQENSGQTSAINTGLKEAQGDIIGWINSDDTYCDGAIEHIINAFCENDTDVVFGDLLVIDKSGLVLKKIRQLPVDMNVGSLIGFGKLVASNTIFWKRSLMNRVGLLNDQFICNMDGEYFARLLNAGKSIHIDKEIAHFRVHSEANSSDFSPAKMKRYKYELSYEIERSYNNLFISKLLPYRYSMPIKLVFKVKRSLNRFMLGHYFS